MGLKEKSKYDIDGIIITANQVNPRVTSGNPKYSFAFKMDLESKTTKVLRGIHQVSNASRGIETGGYGKKKSKKARYELQSLP